MRSLQNPSFEARLFLSTACRDTRPRLAEDTMLAREGGNRFSASAAISHKKAALYEDRLNGALRPGWSRLSSCLVRLQNVSQTLFLKQGGQMLPAMEIND